MKPSIAQLLADARRRLREIDAERAHLLALVALYETRLGDKMATDMSVRGSFIFWITRFLREQPGQKASIVEIERSALANGCVSSAAVVGQTLKFYGSRGLVERLSPGVFALTDLGRQLAEREDDPNRPSEAAE